MPRASPFLVPSVLAFCPHSGDTFFRGKRLTGGHINIAQYLFSLSASQIIQQIEENYNPELLKYEVKVFH